MLDRSDSGIVDRNGNLCGMLAVYSELVVPGLSDRPIFLRVGSNVGSRLVLAVGCDSSDEGCES